MPQAKASTLGALSAMVLGLLFTACSNTTTLAETHPPEFHDVNELFTAVDQHLQCPKETSGHYAFALSDAEPEILSGRSCAESIVMVFSEDAAQIAEIRELLTAVRSETLPIAYAEHWLVADITDAADVAHALELAHPESRDLQGLAAALGATYVEL